MLVTSIGARHIIDLIRDANASFAVDGRLSANGIMGCHND